MRQMAVFLTFMALCRGLANAQEIGDRIVVTAERAQLKIVSDTTGSMKKGTIVTVGKRSGDWFWVVDRSSPGMPKGWVHHRDVLLLDKALEFFTKAIERTPTASAYGIRGALWREKGDLESAIRDLDESVRRDPSAAITFRRRGRTWHKAGDLAKAIADFTEAIRLEPDNPNGYFNRAVVESESADFDKAILDLSAAIQRDPTDPAAFAKRGFAYHKVEKFKEAIADYTEALRLGSTNDMLYLNRGVAHQHLRQYDDAIRDFGKQIERNPHDADAYTKRADVWVSLGDYDKAIADCTEAIRIKPDHASAYNVRANAWFGKPEFEDLNAALADINAAIRLNDKHSYDYATRGAIYCVMHEFRAGGDDLRNAVRLAPTHAHALASLAIFYSICPTDELRDGRKAVELAKQACDLWKWKVPYGLYAIACASAEVGDFESAIKWQQKALDLASDDDKDDLEDWDRAARIGSRRAARFATGRESSSCRNDVVSCKN